MLPTSSSILAALAAHPSRDAWAAAVRESALNAYATREPRLSPPAAAPSAGAEGWQTPYGDLTELLGRPPVTDTERWALSALLALSLASDARRADTADALAWLAARTDLDALSLLDEALGHDAEELWQRLATLARAPQEFSLGRGEALAAAAALSHSKNPAAQRSAQELGSLTTDPLLLAVLATGKEEGPAALQGELTAAPRHPALTALLGLTGVLAVCWVARLIGRLALAYRRPARVRLTHQGLRLEYRTELLGRVLRDREVVVPIEQLAEVTREVRFARAGLYAGLVALTIGIYAGAGLFIDGVRVPGGSFSLIGLAALLILVGLLLDFGLSSLTDGIQGKCRLVVKPQKGPRLCVGSLDPQSADAMLMQLTAARR